MLLFQISGPNGKDNTESTIINYKNEPNQFTGSGVEEIYAISVPAGSAQGIKLDAQDKKIDAQKEEIKKTYTDALTKKLDFMKKEDLKEVYVKIQMKNWEEYREDETVIDKSGMAPKDKVKAHNALTEDYQSHKEENILGSKEYADAKTDLDVKYGKIYDRKMHDFNVCFNQYYARLDEYVAKKVKKLAGDPTESAAKITSDAVLSQADLFLKDKLSELGILEKKAMLGISLDSPVAGLRAYEENKAKLVSSIVKDYSLAHLEITKDGTYNVLADGTTTPLKIFTVPEEKIQHQSDFNSAASILAAGIQKAQFTNSENPTLFAMVNKALTPTKTTTTAPTPLTH